MGNLFGRRRQPPLITEQDRAILQLKQQRDKIKIYQKRTEQQLAKSKELATRLYMEKRVERALVVLKRKKLMDETLARTDKQLETLEILVSDIEFSQIQVSVVEGLRVGSEALKQLNSLVSIADLEKIMEDNEEGAEKQREISRLLQSTSERFDEAELIKELDERAAEQTKQAEPPKQVDTPLTAEIENIKKITQAIPDLPELPQVRSIPEPQEAARQPEPAI